jgi:hypothetical protein
MENIILIKGNVKFTITLDPGVWIFDDRRIDLTTYFQVHEKKLDELEEYTKKISKHWDREIIEGATFTPTIKTEKKFEKVKVLTGTFGIPFKPFLANSEPTNSAKLLVIQTSDGEIEIPLDHAYELILGFSNNGEPLRNEGPIHIYFGDGSNQHDPIKNIQAFFVK